MNEDKEPKWYSQWWGVLIILWVVASIATAVFNTSERAGNWGVKQLDKATAQQPEPPRQLTSSEQQALRLAFCKLTEHNMLMSGIDGTCRVEGHNIRITALLADRPTLYQLTQDRQFVQNLRDTDVHRVIFDNGYGGVWSVDIR